MSSDVIKVPGENISSIDSVVAEASSRVQWKLLVIIFLLMIFINSEVYMTKILSRASKKTVDIGQSMTFYGALITSIIFVIFVAVSDIIIKSGFI